MPSAQQHQLPHISPGNPEAAAPDLVIKFEHLGGAPVPAAHALVLHPFGVGKRQGLYELVPDLRRDVVKSQVVGENYFQIIPPES